MEATGFDYVKETDVTASGHFAFHEEDVNELANDLLVFIHASQRLDKHKKLLFRQRNYVQAGLRTPGPLRLDKFIGYGDADLVHGVIGVATESGELAEVLYNKLVYGHEFDKTNIREEIGDVLWYLARLVKYAGTTFGEAMVDNIAKLRARHGSSFNKERDAKRDLKAERKIFEK